MSTEVEGKDTGGRGWELGYRDSGQGRQPSTTRYGGLGTGLKAHAEGFLSKA